MSGPLGSSQWMYNAGDKPAASLRFNDDDSAYLNRTPSSAGNRKTWTWSGWFKRGNVDMSVTRLFSAGTSLGSNQDDSTYCIIRSTGLNLVSEGSGTFDLNTAQLFRDPSAWYHIVLAVDTEQQTDANRVKIYINGSQVTDFTTETYPAEDSESYINAANIHYIGRTTSTSCWDGYLAEVHFIDGTALTPTSFGETGTYGEWKPIEVSGLTYGTNGFYLDFKDASSLGNDVEGSNNWTVNNLTASDQMLDIPTNNFSTMNPLCNFESDGATLSEGNLKVSAATGSNNDTTVPSTMSVSSGKWYWEVLAVSANFAIGIAEVEHDFFETGPGQSANAWTYYSGNGNIYHDSSNSSYGATYTDGDIIGMALDLDAGTLVCYKNNVSQGTAVSSLSGRFVATVSDMASADNHVTISNFGQDSSFAGNETAQGNQDGNDIGDFYYTPPTGFLALCTSNLPVPAVIPSEHFSIVTYTGTGSSNAITGVGFEPDVTWFKRRNATSGHTIADTIRGDSAVLYPSETDTEYTGSGEGFLSLDSDGFTVDGGGSGGNVNVNTGAYIAWNWKANGSGVSNTEGVYQTSNTLTAQVSANTAAGFSFMTWTNQSDSTIGHGLDSAPELIIVKSREDTTHDYWLVGTEPLGWSTKLFLDTNAVSGATGSFDTTAPTSDVWSLWFNPAGTENVAYCWHSVEGYSKVGSYTGNGQADGTFVYTGFRPKWILIKNADMLGAWYIVDTEQDGGFNSMNNTYSKFLYADNQNAQDNPSGVDFCANGFKLRTPGTGQNYNNSQIIYLAIAETPFKYANAR